MLDLEFPTKQYFLKASFSEITFADADTKHFISIETEVSGQIFFSEAAVTQKFAQKYIHFSLLFDYCHFYII